MTSNLDGRAAVILGASGEGGIGATLAARLREKGMRVMLAARREAELAALAAELDADYLVCDITREDDVAALANAARERYGDLYCAVNAVGQAVMGDIANTSEKHLRQAVDVHLIGPFFFFKHMAEAIGRDGTMITVSSITASRVINNHAAYVAAKAGTDHLVRIAAMEYGGRNIRVNSVAPGFTGDTPMSRGYMELDGLRDLFEKQIPLGRLNTAADVAQAMCWLVDPDTYVTGQTIQVNGGHSLTRMPSKDDFVELMKKQPQ